MYAIKGQCHCGKIQFSAELAQPLSTYSPRACDCEFCRMHDAAYVSDPLGQLQIRVTSASGLHTYRQGSGTAEFLLCPACGVLIAALYRDADSMLYAAVNARAVTDSAAFGNRSSVSPRLLSTEGKVKRWTEYWFARVDLTVSADAAEKRIDSAVVPRAG